MAHVCVIFAPWGLVGSRLGPVLVPWHVTRHAVACNRVPLLCNEPRNESIGGRCVRRRARNRRGRTKLRATVRMGRPWPPAQHLHAHSTCTTSHARVPSRGTLPSGKHVYPARLGTQGLVRLYLYTVPAQLLHARSHPARSAPPHHQAAPSATPTTTLLQPPRRSPASCCLHRHDREQAHTEAPSTATRRHSY